MSLFVEQSLRRLSDLRGNNQTELQTMKKLVALSLLCAVAMPHAVLAQTDDAPAATTSGEAGSGDAENMQAPAASPQREGQGEAEGEAAGAASTGGETDATAATEADAQSVEYLTSQPANSLYSSDLVGYSVHGATDDAIGNINDLLLSSDGRLEAVVIGVGGFLGIGEKNVAVTVSSLSIALVDDEYRISVDATEEQLANAPEFTPAEGTSSDRLGAFEEAFERAREGAEEMLAAAGQQAQELGREAGELSGQALDEASDIIARCREVVNRITTEGEGQTGTASGN